MAEHSEAPQIYVLAGTNGAGKSSVGGAMIRRRGATYFNPDEAAKRILEANPKISQDAANSAAWHQGKRLLERSIAERLDFAFETTLGGRTITRMLETAMSEGMEVRIWYVGLTSPELHIARVRARVARGGHDISGGKIRERYAESRYNLIRLLPGLAGLRVYDNSDEADPNSGLTPEPKLILYIQDRKIVEVCDLTAAPNWTKAILAEASKLRA